MLSLFAGRKQVLSRRGLGCLADAMTAVGTRWSIPVTETRLPAARRGHSVSSGIITRVPSSMTTTTPSLGIASAIPVTITSESKFW